MKLRGLRQARQRSGLSISQLADLTGLRRDTITHLEHGKEEPQAYAIHRLGNALNTTTAELLGMAVLESPESAAIKPQAAPARDPLIAAS